MDESTIGSIRRRVPLLDGEFYSAWKNEMLEIFNEYQLNKYITTLITRKYTGSQQFSISKSDEPNEELKVE